MSRTRSEIGNDLILLSSGNGADKFEFSFNGLVDYIQDIEKTNAIKATEQLLAFSKIHYPRLHQDLLRALEQLAIDLELTS